MGVLDKSIEEVSDIKIAGIGIGLIIGAIILIAYIETSRLESKYYRTELLRLKSLGFDDENTEDKIAESINQATGIPV